MDKQQDETQPVALDGVMSSDGLLYPDDLGIFRNARDLSKRCKELARRLAEQGIATTKEIGGLTAEVERLNATVRERSVLGEIIDMEYASSIGDYFGSFRCPECEAEVEVRLGEKRRRCACGIVWGYDVSATVTREDE